MAAITAPGHDTAAGFEYLDSNLSAALGRTRKLGTEVVAR